LSASARAIVFIDGANLYSALKAGGVQANRRHKEITVHREKGVDVFLACDLVDLARRDAFDVAYLVSGDADFCPAVSIARSMGKRVFVASASVAGRLIRACDVAIRLEPAWFADCGQ
jgi:uncharacterized protein (TIGR00288 family)